MSVNSKHKDSNTDRQSSEKTAIKLIFGAVVLGSFIMAAVTSFTSPELVTAWIGLTVAFGAYLSGISTKIASKLRPHNLEVS